MGLFFHPREEQGVRGGEQVLREHGVQRTVKEALGHVVRRERPRCDPQHQGFLDLDEQEGHIHAVLTSRPHNQVQALHPLQEPEDCQGQQRVHGGPGQVRRGLLHLGHFLRRDPNRLFRQDHQPNQLHLHGRPVLREVQFRGQQTGGFPGPDEP